MNNLTPNDAGRLLLEHDGFLVLTHKNPDPDTLGSALALVTTLCAAGKSARAVCSDPVPESKLSLFGGYTFKDDGSPYSYVVTVDVADTVLLGDFENLSGSVDLMIDHHVLRCALAENVCVDPSAAACAEIVYDICRAICAESGTGLTKEAASYLYAGISADTGGFIYSNTTSRTHMIAAALLGLGINSAEINEILHIIKPEARIRAEAFVASKMIRSMNGRIASVAITLSDMKLLGCSDEMLSEIVNIPRSVEGVDIAVSLREVKPGEYKVSLRSRSSDVSEVAAVFGGGGHMKAAGCTVTADDPEKARAAVVAECRKRIKLESKG